MLKNIALTLFAVVVGMSWIILVKDREVEYNAAKTVYLEESDSIEVDVNEEHDLQLDNDYYDNQDVINS